MKIDSRSFTTRRYRALYYLLPVANGALIAVAYAIIHGLTGLSQLATAATSGDYGLLVDMIFFMAMLMLPVLAIMFFDIVFLALVYGKDTFLFAFRRLAPGWADEDASLPFMGPILLTMASGTAVVLILRGLSLWTPSAGEGSTGTTGLAAIIYILAVVPVLVHGERTLRGRANSATEEAGA